MDMSSLISLAIAVTGILFSIKLYGQRRKLTQLLKGAMLVEPDPPRDKSIGNYIEDHRNQKCLEAFYDASKSLKLILYSVLGLGLIILVVLMIFHLRMAQLPVLEKMIQYDVTLPDNKMVFQDDGGKVRAEVGLPRSGWVIIKVNIDGWNVEKVKLDEQSSLNYLTVDENGKVRRMLFPEMILGTLVFIFLISLVVCFFIINRMEDFVSGLKPNLGYKPSETADYQAV